MILLFGHPFLKNHKIHDIPSCFRIENETFLELSFRIAFGLKWQIGRYWKSIFNFFTKVVK